MKLETKARKIILVLLVLLMLGLMGIFTLLVLVPDLPVDEYLLTILPTATPEATEQPWTAAPTVFLTPIPVHRATATPGSPVSQWLNRRNLVKYPVFDPKFPARRMNIPVDWNARAPVAGTVIWPEPESMTPLQRLLFGP